LLDLSLQMKTFKINNKNTMVFSSSIFFIAFSVAIGLKITEYLSKQSLDGIPYLTVFVNLGFLAILSVLGL